MSEWVPDNLSERRRTWLPRWSPHKRPSYRRCPRAHWLIRWAGQSSRSNSTPLVRRISDDCQNKDTVWRTDTDPTSLTKIKHHQYSALTLRVFLVIFFVPFPLLCARPGSRCRCSLPCSLRHQSTVDDDDNGFGATVRYAPVVTKVRYRKKILLKKHKN